MLSGPTARIDLAALAHNWRALAALHPDAETGAVVKAEGYGLGAAQVSHALLEAGCRTFFTAYAEEGAEVRAALGPEPLIYALNGPDAGNLPVYQDAALRPVINTPEQLALWKADAPSRPAALKFDTGMNRLGLRAENAGDIAQQTAGMQITHIFSHLACADEPASAMNAAQLDRFKAVLAHFPGAPPSLANSAGTGLGADYGQALTRPGIALYGGGEPPAGADIKPVVTITARILSVHHGLPGESVGYGATARLTTKRTLATVAYGYADGLPRSLSNKGFGVLGDVRCPILGRISMDLTTLDVTEAGEAARPGARVEFIGPNAPLEEQALSAGTLGYELLTGIGPRVERIYVD